MGPHRTHGSRPVRQGRLPRLPVPVRPLRRPGEADRTAGRPHRRTGRSPAYRVLPRRDRTGPVLPAARPAVRRNPGPTAGHPGPAGPGPARGRRPGEDAVLADAVLGRQSACVRPRVPGSRRPPDPPAYAAAVRRRTHRPARAPQERSEVRRDAATGGQGHLDVGVLGAGRRPGPAHRLRPERHPRGDVGGDPLPAVHRHAQELPGPRRGAPTRRRRGHPAGRAAARSAWRRDQHHRDLPGGVPRRRLHRQQRRSRAVPVGHQPRRGRLQPELGPRGWLPRPQPQHPGRHPQAGGGRRPGRLHRQRLQGQGRPEGPGSQAVRAVRPHRPARRVRRLRPGAEVRDICPGPDRRAAAGPGVLAARAGAGRHPTGR